MKNLGEFLGVQWSWRILFYPFIKQSERVSERSICKDLGCFPSFHLPVLLQLQNIYTLVSGADTKQPMRVIVREFWVLWRLKKKKRSVNTWYVLLKFRLFLNRSLVTTSNIDTSIETFGTAHPKMTKETWCSVLRKKRGHFFESQSGSFAPYERILSWDWQEST